MRKIKQSDIPQLLVIESSVHIAPWSEETFKICFNSPCLGFVECDEKTKEITGFIITVHRQDECHILNLAVSRLHQRQGVGKRLLKHTLNEMKKRQVSIVYLEVRCTNTPAIKLYDDAGFQKVGERKDYYPTVNGAEDAWVLAKWLA